MNKNGSRLLDNRKQKIIISITGIVLVSLILIGLTYAYFLTQITGNTNTKSISVSTAKLELSYADGNGIITGSNIMPGTTLTEKKFTVTNNGNATVSNYAVYLEEVVNELTRTEDMVYELKCESSKSWKTCNGTNEISFPKLAGIIVTNTIEVGETQSYKLIVTYKEMGVDQSEDMNKTLSARVQIYNLRDIVDVTGTVTNASEGDYVEMHSDPKMSMITKDSKYLIAAVEPGVHTIYVKDKNGTIKGSKEIVIKKGDSANISGTNITVTNDSQTINANIKKIDATLTIDFDETQDYMPFKEGTLANAIYLSAKTNANGTKYNPAPLTKPVKSSTLTNYGKKESLTETKLNITAAYQKRYWTYGTGYEFDEKTGVFNLTGVSTCQYNDGTCHLTLVGKYLPARAVPTFTSTTDTVKNTTNLTNVYKIVEAPESSTKTISVNIKGISSQIQSTEKELSTTSDNNGISYYYRGGVEDNYVNFAGMCFRIVRIRGDGSIKLILEDRNAECNDNETTVTTETYTGNWSDGNEVVFGYGSNSYPDFVNYSGGLIDTLENFQSSKISNDLYDLMINDWCYDDKVLATRYYIQNSNGFGYTEIESPDETTGNYFTVKFYEAEKRLETNKESSLICNGSILKKYRDNTNMLVGTLTADEFAFAGASNTANSTYYLMNNYSNNNKLPWWSSSIQSYSTITGLMNAYILNSDGTLYPRAYHGGESAYARPSIILKPEIQILNGNGTISNPYIIAS